MFLAQIPPHPSPRPGLEQYTIPVDIAATMLYLAAYTYGDIVGKKILDLGCGTGRLALGAAFLGAKQVVGIDLDKGAVRVASEISVKAELKERMRWIIGDITAIRGDFDTVLQNPPFGVQKPKADTTFLEKALKTGKTIYSLHKHLEKNALQKRIRLNESIATPIAPPPFFKKFVDKRRGKIRSAYAMVMTIPRMFDFHTKRRHKFIVDLLVIDRS
jgi:putative methylase